MAGEQCPEMGDATHCNGSGGTICNVTGVLGHQLRSARLHRHATRGCPLPLANHRAAIEGTSVARLRLVAAHNQARAGTACATIPNKYENLLFQYVFRLGCRRQRQLGG